MAHLQWPQKQFSPINFYFHQMQTFLQFKFYLSVKVIYNEDIATLPICLVQN